MKQMLVPTSKSTLKKLYHDDKLSMLKIADLLGVSYTCVRNRMVRMDIGRRSLSDSWKFCDRKVEFPLFDAYRMYEEGSNFRELSDFFGVSKTLLRDSFKRSGFSLRKQRDGWKAVSRLSDEDLAYLYGVLLGDGHISQRSYSFRLKVADSDFALHVFAVMKRVGSPVMFMEYRKGNRKDLFCVYFNSKRFIKQFESIQYDDLSGRQKCFFINGFIDSEGSVSDVRKCISIGNTNGKLLGKISEFLELLGISNRIYTQKNELKYTDGFYYILYVWGLKNLEKFRKYFKFSIKCKQRRLDGCILK